MKKYILLVIVFSMCLCMTVTAFAESSDEYTKTFEMDNGFVFALPEDFKVKHSASDILDDWVISGTIERLSHSYMFFVTNVENTGNIYDSIVAFELDHGAEEEPELYYYASENGEIYSDDILEVVYNGKIGDYIYAVYVIHDNSIIKILNMVDTLPTFDDVIEMIYAGFDSKNQPSAASSESVAKASPKPESVDSSTCSHCHGSRICPACLGEDCSKCNGSGETLCSKCRGSGDCQHCYGGGGEYKRVGLDVKWVKCNYCTSGKCSKCHGEGFETCTRCGGKGSSCSACGGTGRCPYC